LGHSSRIMRLIITHCSSRKENNSESAVHAM
jgi:hypothetical protein